MSGLVSIVQLKVSPSGSMISAARFEIMTKTSSHALLGNSLEITGGLLSSNTVIITVAIFE